MPRVPNCPSCGAPLRKKTRANGSAAGCLFGFGGILIGLGIFILIPIIGWVLGPIIMLVCMGIGMKKPDKIWACKRCRFTTIR